MTSPLPSYRGYRFPPGIISYAVRLYHRFDLSVRDIEDLLAERGVTVTYEAIRQWCRTFGLDYAHRLQRRRGRSICGVPSMKTATRATFFYSRGVTGGRPFSSSGSC